MTWGDRARAAIGRIHAGLPAEATYAQRVAALRDGYPFGPRENAPYQAWLKAQRAYLARYRPAGPHRPIPQRDGQPSLF
ncbi:hypothetical protein [Methylorubrum populi]|uniref:hypothetical protein n=1 Tax=Methylorubrum populi TaxID=223967 RepID=UPI0000383242|nr:hypothetical protein [Methylorubrum populi]PZP68370.1 MAG: hypothetical protein DI590_16610 [Methylorubrum populi]